MKNGDETDVDCGGSCDPCDDGASCTDAADCTSRRCVDGTCEARLTTGEACTSDDECASGDCHSFGDVSVCSEPCDTTCPGDSLACFDGLCTPRDYCDDPDGDGDGYGDGPGCTGTVCDLCAPSATCSE